MEESIDAKRIKLQKVLDFSSDPVPCSEISTSVTTMKVFLSWCKNDKGRVVEIVTRFRKKLWERGIEVIDSDVERCVGKERYIPIPIMTVDYFYDAECLRELEVICELPHSKYMLPIYYDPDGELKRLRQRIMRGPDAWRPLRVPMNTQWYPPPDDVDADTAILLEEKEKGKKEDSDEEDMDCDDDDDGGEVEDNDDDSEEDDDDGDEVEDNDDDSEEEEDDDDYYREAEEIIIEENKKELTYGDALDHISTYSESLNELTRKAEHDFIDHFALLIWMFLNPASLDYTNLVGLESHLTRLNSYLFNGEESMYIAITGPEGSGKTTAAKYLYNRFCHFHPIFTHTRMISNPTSLSLRELAAKVFTEDAGFSTDDSFNPKEHRGIADIFKSLRMLIIFDNINSANDLSLLAPVLNLLPQNGSKVVFVTKDDSWLKSVRRIQKYPIPALGVNSSLELFCLRAFKQNQPPKRYIKLADNVVKRSKGNPSELVHCAAQFCLMISDDSWTKAFHNDEDMDSVFWSKYVPRYSKPTSTGSCQPENETKKSYSFGDNWMCLRGHSSLWSQIWFYFKRNAFDTEADRAQLVYGWKWNAFDTETDKAQLMYG